MNRPKTAGIATCISRIRKDIHHLETVHQVEALPIQINHTGSAGSSSNTYICLLDKIN